MDRRWPASAGAAAHVFLDALDDRLTVGGEDGHHLARVLRLRVGEPVTVADGRGRWRPYTVTSTGRSAGASVVELEATAPSTTEPDSAPRVAVAFSLTKGEKPELAIQKLTELGVDRILPVLSARSVARPDPGRAADDARRWRRVALEAAKQCRRARLPEVAPLSPLAGLAGHPGLVVAEWGAPSPSALGPPPGGEVLVVIGPEGGLSPAEVEHLDPWGRVGLAVHVLRAETAALAAAVLLRAPAALRD